MLALALHALAAPAPVPGACPPNLFVYDAKRLVRVKTSFLVPSVESVEVFGDDFEAVAPLDEVFHPGELRRGWWPFGGAGA